MGRCNYCGRKVADVVEHIRKTHMGRLSEDSVRYLLSQGVPYFRILEYGGDV